MRRSIPALSISGWILALAVFGLQPFPAEAEVLRAIPSLLLEERWDSNVFNTSSNEQSDFVTRATPRLGLSFRAFQDNILLRGSLEAEKYADHTELDSNSSVKSLELTTEGPMRFSPRFSLTPYARYLEARDTFRRNELTLVPGDVNLPPDSLASAREKVREYTATIQTVTLLSPRLDLGVGGGWVKREFPEDTARLQDGSRAITGNATLNFRASPRFAYGPYADVVYTSYDNNPNSRIYTGGLSAIYDWSAFLRIEARAGASYLRQATVSGDGTDTNWSPNGRLAFTYAKADFRARLSGDYGYSGGGSFGQPTQRGNVSLSFTNQFVSRWWWDLSGYYQTARSVDDPITEDLATTSGTAAIRYQAASWATISLSGNVYDQEDNGPTNDSVRRQTIMLGFDLSSTYTIF
jgi:hypothetical protein